ncbi:phage terminase large subunit [Acinetobacter baumannii]|uniref:phage terminase large subunit n=2 Tax=Acinetobacter baumannii TaxID=470 RepID=UPI0002BAE062|nr:phage terminase large subunit [Acinetobacter baumannii]EHZ7971967.1 phage terminase large subunit [Acinetobacter baumannii]EIO2226413.1 phage terminase large subunit [Acinetobacter baumannii]EJD6090626.1 phage terminase large subunit [Acinetobacter baumannii]EJN6995526.1 phage terminase large subunit [Acinetobacter baumannii]EKT9097391.1 phage terminase large subunit [Acinetobacter baumannii]
MNSKVNTKLLEMQLERELCEKEHLFFTRRFFLPRMGFKFSVNWHHEYIADKIDEVIAGKVKNLVINVPPGSGKTELLTNLIARGIARNARSRFLYLSFSQSLVEDVSATARNIVKSEDFQNLWPVKISTSTDAKSSWKTTVNGYDAGHVYSASMGGQVTGRRAGTLANEGFTGAIILDDPLKPEDAFSQTARRKAKSDTPIILIMQRLHLEDPTNFVLTGNVPGEWEQISIPALIDDEYISKLPEHIQRKIPRDVERDEKGRQSYWPLKESLLSLLQLEKGGEDKDGATVSRYTFASQYMQNPKKLGGDLVKAEWFGRYEELPLLKWRAIWADTAQKTKEHNDFSVFLCAGLGYDNNLYIIDVKRGKWEAPELLKEAKAFINKHKDSNTKIGKLRYMAVEDKSSGTGLIQSISRQTTLPIRAIQRDTDKLTRTMDVVFYVEERRVWLPAEAPWLLNYIEEIEGLTADMSHDHDDQWDPTIDAINDSLAKKPTVFDD